MLLLSVRQLALITLRNKAPCQQRRVYLQAIENNLAQPGIEVNKRPQRALQSASGNILLQHKNCYDIFTENNKETETSERET